MGDGEMPKEVIYTTKRFEDSPDVHPVVIWNRDREVQLGVVRFDGGDPAVDGTDKGWWETLDRHDCNKLIQVLRRARDQAYGKDA